MDVYTSLSLLVLVVSATVCLILLLVDAPYGKRERDGWGPGLPVRWAWLLLELPSFGLPLWVLYRSESWPAAPGLLLLALWLAHYFYRSFIYPLTFRAKPGQRFAIIMLLAGAPMNAVIGWLIATMVISEPHLQSAGWLCSPQFLSGVTLFVAGFALTRYADTLLRRLRKPGDGGYYIPYGVPFRWVSCPNYSGELLQWAGFAVAAWALPAAAFWVYSAANLVPRALAAHRWYREQFADYPPQRRALIPGLL